MSYLDKQVNAQKECLKIKFRGSRKPTKRCAMKMKVEEKKRRPLKNIFIEGKEFIKLYQKTGPTDFDELRVIDSPYNEGTNTVVTSDSG